MGGHCQGGVGQRSTHTPWHGTRATRARSDRRSPRGCGGRPGARDRPGSTLVGRGALGRGDDGTAPKQPRRRGGGSERERPGGSDDAGRVTRPLLGDERPAPLGVGPSTSCFRQRRERGPASTRFPRIQKKPHPIPRQIRSLTAKDAPKRTPNNVSTSKAATMSLSLSARRGAFRRYPWVREANQGPGGL